MAEPLRIEIRDGPEGWEEARQLEPLVYTRELMAHVEWHDVDWSHAEQWVLGWIGETLVTAAGIHSRDVEVDGEEKLVAGVGGVMTHPEHREQGHSSAALETANEVIAGDIDPAFSLIFVEPHNVEFYANRGWRVFEGEVIVEERGQRGVFPYMGTMLRDGNEEAPASGMIDMLGRPW